MRIIQAQRCHRPDQPGETGSRPDGALFGCWPSRIALVLLLLLGISSAGNGETGNSPDLGATTAATELATAESEDESYSNLEAEVREAREERTPSLIAAPASKPTRASVSAIRSADKDSGTGSAEELKIDLPGYRREVDALLIADSSDPNTQREADSLYSRLSHDLWAYRAQVREAIANRSPHSLAYSARMIAIYDQRDRLLFLVSPD
ncbi:hypothetical protein MK280_11995, partial [Myxococcota bacterium]|nr:hypothetical protein [Myxococcota bacterium]